MEAIKWNKTIHSEEVDDKRKVRKDKKKTKYLKQKIMMLKVILFM